MFERARAFGDEAAVARPHARLTLAYAALGLGPEASDARVRSAFCRIVRKVHPDVDASPSAAQRFQQVLGAYRLINITREHGSTYQSGELIVLPRVVTRRQRAMDAAAAVALTVTAGLGFIQLVIVVLPR